MMITDKVFEKEEDGHYYVHFDSPTEMWEELCYRAKRPAHPDNYDKVFEVTSRAEEFTGYENLDSYLDALDRGDDDLLLEIQHLLDEIKHHIELPVFPARRVKRRQETGQELDPLCHVMRNPDGWTDVKREMITRPVVRVIVNASLSASHRQEHLIYRGAAAVALCDYLEQSGVRVELVMADAGKKMFAAGSGNIKTVTTLTLKKPESPLNTSTIAFCCCKLPTFRVLFLGVIAGFSPKTVSWNLGIPTTLTKRVSSEFDYIVEHNLNSKQSVMDFLNKSVAKVSSHVEHLH